GHVIDARFAELLGPRELTERAVFIRMYGRYCRTTAFPGHCPHQPSVRLMGQRVIAVTGRSRKQPVELAGPALNFWRVGQRKQPGGGEATRNRPKPRQ